MWSLLGTLSFFRLEYRYVCLIEGTVNLEGSNPQKTPAVAEEMLQWLRAPSVLQGTWLGPLAPTGQFTTVTTDPGDLTPYFGLWTPGTNHTHGAQTYVQVKH